MWLKWEKTKSVFGRCRRQGIRSGCWYDTKCDVLESCALFCDADQEDPEGGFRPCLGVR